ncbi:MAG TPA: hypothetical protein VEZ12_15045 [Herpetosiphonaceae bacterium]|nr:hypothetical protein [Herpetosiphonaceae bacterium]
MTTTNDTTGEVGTLEDIPLADLERLIAAITIVKHERAAAALAVPRMHEIGGVTFFLNRTGALTLDERQGQRPLVRLTPTEAFAVLSFMRQPGVAELIEQQEAAPAGSSMARLRGRSRVRRRMAS